MKIFIVVTILSLSLLGDMLNKRVSVAIDPEYLPFSYRDVNGQPTGMFVEFWREWGRVNGYDIDFLFYDWDGTLKAVKSGEAIFHMGTTPDSDWMVSSEKIYEMSTLFYKLVERDINFSKKLKIGTIDNYFGELAQENFPNSEVKIYNDYTPLIRAIQSREIDIFIDDEVAVDLFTLKSGIKNRFQKLQKRFISNIHVITNRENREYIEIFNRGVKNLDINSLIEIESNWLDKADGYYYNLNKQKREKFLLTNSERAWIAENPSVNFTGVPEFLPYGTFETERQYIGIIREYLNIIEKSSGVIFLTNSPQKSWSRAIEMAESGAIDMIVGDIGDKLEDSFSPVEKSLSSEVVIVMDDRSSRVKDPYYLVEKRVAILKGYGYGDLIREKYNFLDFIEVETVSDGLKKVATGSLDALFVPLSSVAYSISEMGLSNLKIVGKSDIKMEIRFYIRNDLKTLHSIIDRLLSSISKQQHQEIVSAWIKNRDETLIDYSIAWKVIASALIVISLTLLWNMQMRREIKRREDAERVSREKMRENEAILSAIIYPMLITSTDSRRILYANREAEKKYEAKKGELIGKGIDFVYTQDNQRHDILSVKNKYGVVRNLEMRYKSLTGREFDALLSLVDIEYKGEKSYLGIVTDITEQKERESQLLEQKRIISESIKSASYIQNAILPRDEILKKFFLSNFVIWEPRDSVGGDIYFFEEISEKELLIYLIDCTGHGVPGAFVTMVVKSLHRQLSADIQYGRVYPSSPADILSFFHREIDDFLNRDRETTLSEVGFDGGVLYLNFEKEIAVYGGAKTPLFYTENGEINIIRGDRHSVGYGGDSNITFNNHLFSLKNVSHIYLVTDGFYDQIGGDKGLPFGKSRLGFLLENLSVFPMEMQREDILRHLLSYQGDNERVDDVTFIGLELSEEQHFSKRDRGKIYLEVVD
jgi:PAS domain S-box-containing protein